MSSISKVFVVLVIGAMLVSQPVPTSSQQTVRDLIFIIPALDVRQEQIATFIQQSWLKMFLDVNLNVLSVSVFASSLGAEPADKNWDLALVDLENYNKLYPELFNYFSNVSKLAATTFGINSTKTMENSGVDVTKLNDILYSTLSATEDQRNELIRDFQRLFMTEWLFMLPLLEKKVNAFVNKNLDGFDIQEGIRNSIFHGMDWKSNTAAREDEGYSEDHLNSFFNRDVGNLNPLISSSDDVKKIQQAIYSSLFIYDKEGKPHPDLAIQYDIEENGSDVTYYFKLREDAFWRERDGTFSTPVTTKDVKFTIDMYTLPFTQVSTPAFLVSYKSTEIINSTDMRITFEGKNHLRLTDLGNMMIIPEHILNGTLHDTFGDSLGNLYEDEISPLSSLEWVDFGQIPITSGAYYRFDKQVNDYFLRVNENYYFPNEVDSPDFDLTVDGLESPYFFMYEDNPSTSSVEKPTNLPITSWTIRFNEFDGATIFIWDTGVADILTSEDLYNFGSLEETDVYQLQQAVVPNTGEFVVLNLENSFFQNFEIRKALLMSLDRDVLKTIPGLGQRPLNSSINTYYSDYYINDYAIPYDFDGAVSLFNKNGYQAGLEKETNKSFFPMYLLPVILVAPVRKIKR